jgi:hypothetical protein
MHEIHTLAFTLYKVFLTVAQLEEVTRREFIDTAADGLVGLQSRLECLLLTNDAFAALLFCRCSNRVNTGRFSHLGSHGLQ